MFLTSLLLLVLFSRLLGEIATRLGQPKLIGEITAGILLGPAVFNWVQPTPSLQGIAELAVFLVVLSAGLEMKFEDVVRAFRGKGLLVALLAFLIPLFSGLFVGLLFGLGHTRTLFLGLCISITALPVAVRILENFKILNSDIARYAIGSAIINDVLALLALGAILNAPEQPSLSAAFLSILASAGKLVLLAAAIVLGNWIVRRLEKIGIHLHALFDRLSELFGKEALFSLMILFVMAFSSVSEMLGFHFVIGAFFGALLLTQELFGEMRFSQLEGTIGSISSGFLAPVFFAYLGLEFDLGAFRSPFFLLVVLAVSIVSKIYAGWIGGRMLRMPPNEALGLGIILNGRGIMELVVAGIALNRGLIEKPLFSTLVFMGIVTTLITPILFQRYVRPAVSSGG